MLLRLADGGVADVGQVRHLAAGADRRRSSPRRRCRSCRARPARCPAAGRRTGPTAALGPISSRCRGCGRTVAPAPTAQSVSVCPGRRRRPRRRRCRAAQLGAGLERHVAARARRRRRSRWCAGSITVTPARIQRSTQPAVELARRSAASCTRSLTPATSHASARRRAADGEPSPRAIADHVGQVLLALRVVGRQPRPSAVAQQRRGRRRRRPELISRDRQLVAASASRLLDDRRHAARLRRARRGRSPCGSSTSAVSTVDGVAGVVVLGDQRAQGGAASSSGTSP